MNEKVKRQNVQFINVIVKKAEKQSLNNSKREDVISSSFDQSQSFMQVADEGQKIKIKAFFPFDNNKLLSNYLNNQSTMEQANGKVNEIIQQSPIIKSPLLPKKHINRNQNLINANDRRFYSFSRSSNVSRSKLSKQNTILQQSNQKLCVAGGFTPYVGTNITQIFQNEFIVRRSESRSNSRVVRQILRLREVNQKNNDSVKYAKNINRFPLNLSRLNSQEKSKRETHYRKKRKQITLQNKINDIQYQNSNSKGKNKSLIHQNELQDYLNRFSKTQRDPL